VDDLEHDVGEVALAHRAADGVALVRLGAALLGLAAERGRAVAVEPQPTKKPVQLDEPGDRRLVGLMTK
jgi:hypothetical protein